MQFLKNPIYIYVLSFGLIMILYGLGWSSLYPKLTLNLILFFVTTFVISLYLGAVVDKYRKICFSETKDVTFFRFNMILIIVLNVIEIIYNKGVPLMLVITGFEYDYRQYGIPFFHPLIATYTSFYTIFVFHDYISKKEKSKLFSFILLISLPILIYNRGAFLMTLVSCFFVYFMTVKKIRLKVATYSLIIVLVVLYFFGVLGNYRLVGQNSNDYFLKITEATPEFIDSRIPKEYMWAYVYSTSPLANLQNNLNESKSVDFNIKSFLFNELTPDFISKRLTNLLNVDESKTSLIRSFLTVGTMYSKSYTTMGWLGMILMYIASIGGIFCYIFLLKRVSNYYVTGIALSCTFVLFSSFSNMIRFSGLSFQLIYPLLFMYIKRPFFVFQNHERPNNENV